MAYGAFTRRKREEKGIGLNAMARRLGVSPAYLSRIERELEHPPKDELVEKTAAILEVPIDDLFTEARRFPPEMKEDVARAIRLYRRYKEVDSS